MHLQTFSIEPMINTAPMDIIRRAAVQMASMIVQKYHDYVDNDVMVSILN